MRNKHEKNMPTVIGWGCMYYLPSLRRGTVRERSLAFWERRGKAEEGILGLRRDGQRIVLVHQSEETCVLSQEVVIKVNRSHCSTRMDDTNVGVTIIDGLLAF
jgi:hypothetical protein